MAKAAPKDDEMSGQWPVAITLVLCALFAAVILLLAKRDYDRFHRDATHEAASEARLITSQIDAAIREARASLVAASGLGMANGATVAATAPGLQAVASFDSKGVLVSQGSASSSDIGALAAAAQMAQTDGWSGAVALGGGRYSPAISVRTVDGGALAAFVTFKRLDALGPGRRVGVGEPGGNLISVQPAFKAVSTQGALAAFGLKSPPAAGSALGYYVRDVDGQNIVVGTAVAENGLTAFVSRDRGPIEAAWLRSAIMFGLLFLGPVLAAAGIWFLVQGQSERFATARVQMRDAERRLRVAIEGARCGVWDWDITNDRVYLTQRLAQSFGLLGAGRFDTQEVLQALSAEDQARLRAALASAAQIGVLDVVVKITRASGVTHVQLRGRAAVDRQRPGSIRAIGVSIDVSEERNSEARVAAAERRLRDAIDSISGPFALWSKDRRLILWNGGFAKTFGLDGTILQTGASYTAVSAAAAKRVKSQRPDRYDELAQEIELDNGVWIQLVERETSDGGLVSIGIDISPLKETEESIMRSERQMRSVVVELERSEHKASELAEKYRTERQRAEEASNAKSGFLANMSHELRTPLNAINGFSEIMVQQLYGPLGDRRYLTYATDILNSGKHLLELINDVLDMAKVEAGKFKIYPKLMDLQETIEQAMRLVRGRSEEKGIALVGELAEAGDVTGDARAIKQIMINLLSNAIKFTPENGKVLVQVKNNLDSVIIRVIDNGIGIKAEDLPRLARPFEQVENEHARSNQGSGLGLALSRSFAEMHGGTLTIASEVGVGTMVIVSLPRLAVAQQEAA